MKLCECGCGEPAPIASITNRKNGAVEGQPQRFVHGHNTRVAHPNARPLELRFWEKVNKEGPLPRVEAVAIHPEIANTLCWLWTGSINHKGYGNLKYEGKTQGAHRVSWIISHGKCPDDQCLHKCDNRACVRPSHLFEGDNAMNNADMMIKNRGKFSKGENQGIAKLNSSKVMEIRERHRKGEPMKSLAKRFNTVPGNISNIVRRINWRHVQ